MKEIDKKRKGKRKRGQHRPYKGLNPVFLVHRQRRNKERSKRRGPSWIEREIQGGKKKKREDRMNEWMRVDDEGEREWVRER